VHAPVAQWIRVLGFEPRGRKFESCRAYQDVINGIYPVFRGFKKYKLVYAHLWHEYLSSWYVRTGFILKFIVRICQLILLPIALSLIIASLSKQDFAAAQQAVFFFAGASLVMGILTPLAKYLAMLGENKSYRTITTNYFAHLVSADLDYFSSNLAGYLTTATRHYVDGCMMLIRALRDRYMHTILGILFPLGVIFWTDSVLGAITLVLSFVQAAYLLWASHTIAPYRTRAREIYKFNSGRMADIVSNILAVKSNAQEAARIKEIRQGALDEANVFEVRYTLQSKLIALRECITVTFFLLLLWLVVQRMSGGFIDITGAILVVTYTTTIMTSIYALSENLDEHDDFVDKIIPAFEILHRKNSITDPQHPKTLGRVKGDVNFNNVLFEYEKGQPVFKAFNLKIPAGQKIGIVGLSGAGKSTLTKLLLRFNDVNSGSITIDGNDVRDVTQTDLRNQIAYVPQEPLLFHNSIEQNVRIGKPGATKKEIIHALQTAHAWQFVQQLPGGLDSVVGERGVKLSGGQKQRIAIARAVLRHSPIIVLDEATSALDSESEQIIKDSFAQILKGKTAIVIAHRLSTLSEMDRIVVIDKGKCIEDGTHAQLLAKNGAYARLWKRQQRHIEDA
jgi:ATP-binding cassette subfamily B protein